MQISRKRFGKNNITVEFASGLSEVTTVYYYESKTDLFDVIVSPFSGKLMFRKNMGDWEYVPEHIHELVIDHYNVKAEYRVAV